MNPVAAALIVGAITTFGRWSRGKDMTVDTVVGVVGIAVALAIIDQINKDLARAFSTLVVVGVLVYHGNAIFGAITKGGKKPGGPLPK